MHIFIKNQSSACMKGWLYISTIFITTAYVLILLYYLFHNIYLPSLAFSGIDLKFKTLVYIVQLFPYSQAILHRAMRGLTPKEKIHCVERQVGVRHYEIELWETTVSSWNSDTK